VSMEPFDRTESLSISVGLVYLSSPGAWVFSWVLAEIGIFCILSAELVENRPADALESTLQP
jgi:hypothetical protein